MTRHETFSLEPKEQIPCDTPCNGMQYCMPVTNKGKVYRCAKTLAKAYGVTPAAVYKTLTKHGHTERLGNPRGGRNNKRPVKIGQFSWPSVTALASDLGMERSHINHILNRNPERLLGLVMKKKSP